MSGLIRQLMAKNLKVPQRGLGAVIVKKFLKERTTYQEIIAAQSCNIQPDDVVLEVGFGPGIGLEAAYTYVKDGRGKIYGIDLSDAMVTMATKRLRSEIKEGKVQIQKGNVMNLPFEEQMFDHVFHCNCFFFWEDQKACAQELHRVMKPGKTMLALMNRKGLQYSIDKGYFSLEQIDWDRYITALDKAGFVDINLSHLKDTENSGKPYQLISAQSSEKSSS